MIKDALEFAIGTFLVMVLGIAAIFSIVFH